MSGVHELSPVWLTEAARLLPELLEQHADLAPPMPFTESWQYQRLFTALGHALLRANQPLLLLLDDLQWCDAETLTWLHFFLRFAATMPARTIPTHACCCSARIVMTNWTRPIRSVISWARCAARRRRLT
ncbi:MAG: hypothetical protein R3A10_05495 [Caldilineaceae bacterium]